MFNSAIRTFAAVSATAALTIAAGLATAPKADAYTTHCGTASRAFEADHRSPRYYGNATDIMIGRGGHASYRLSRNNWIDGGRWYRSGNDVVIINPDGSTTTMLGGWTARCSDHY